jgi:hypothetical protein
VGFSQILLIDKVPLKQYNVVSVSEMLGIEIQDETIALCYTPNSSLAPRLLDNCKQFKMDDPYRNVSYIGDFNVHNSDWICSTGDKDAGGIQAEEMCEMFGLNQLIGLSTCGENTLDLAMTIHDGVAIEQPGAGTSDHIAIAITLELDTNLLFCGNTRHGCILEVPSNESLLHGILMIVNQLT